MFGFVQTYAARFLLVALVVGLPLAGWSGYRHGRAVEQGIHNTAVADAQARVIADTLVKLEAAQARAVKIQRARDQLADQLGRLERDAKRDGVPATACTLDPAEQRLLDDKRAARLAAVAAAAGKVRGHLPEPARADPAGADQP